MAGSTRPNPLRTRVWTAGRILVLVVALAGTFGAFFLTAMRVATRAREVTVPNLAGKSVADATTVVAGLGLDIKVDAARRADAKIPADHVLSQDPEPGTVLRRQRSVHVRLSDGERAPFVPTVIGQSERTAEIALTQQRIQIAARAEVRTASYDPGTVIAQDPPSKVRGSTVALLISRSDEGRGFVMPDVIGAPFARVLDILRQAGLRVPQPAQVTYPNIPPGVVVHQSPQAGFQVAPGALVSLEVSR